MKTSVTIVLLRLVTATSLATTAAAAQAQSVANCEAAKAYSAQRGGVSFLVLKDGKVISEDYPNGSVPDQPHLLASGTKSFTGLIAAAAVQDGFLKLDDKVSDTITEWKVDSRKTQITVRQILSLTSGLNPGDNQAPPPYSQAVKQPLIHEPGSYWEYGPAPFQIFGEVIKRKLTERGDAPDPLLYLDRRLLKPIGISCPFWRRSVEGDANMPSGAALTAREWAKLGEFVRGGGKVRGKPLVDPEAFSQLFQGSKANPGYGLSWWLPGEANLIDSHSEPIAERSLVGVPKDIRMAAGAGKQRLYVIPSLGVTIVRQTDKRSPKGRNRQGSRGKRTRVITSELDSRWSDSTFLHILLDGK